MPTAYVYVFLEEGPVPAGILETSGTGREAAARFRYGRRYLQRKDRLAVDPVQLPLTAPDADREKLCVSNGFTALEIERLRNCFLACNETIQGT